MPNAWFDDTVTPMLDGYHPEQAQTFITSEFVTGRRRNRKRYTTAPFTLSASFVVDYAKMRLFEAWFRSSVGANDGLSSFNMPVKLPAGGNIQSECRVIQGYGMEPYGPFMYRINMAVEFVERPQFAGEDYQYNPSFIEFADVFDNAVNVEIPGA